MTNCWPGRPGSYAPATWTSTREGQPAVAHTPSRSCWPAKMRCAESRSASVGQPQRAPLGYQRGRGGAEDGAGLPKLAADSVGAQAADGLAVVLGPRPAGVAGAPPGVRFATKPQLARAMLQRALAAGAAVIYEPPDPVRPVE